MHSDKVAEAYQIDPITLLDDLIQLLTDSDQDDLAHDMNSILLKLDSRLHAKRVA